MFVIQVDPLPQVAITDLVVREIDLGGCLLFRLLRSECRRNEEKDDRGTHERTKHGEPPGGRELADSTHQCSNEQPAADRRPIVGPADRRARPHPWRGRLSPAIFRRRSSFRSLHVLP